MSAGGSAVAEVLAELQSLPRNGKLRAPGTVGLKPLHRSSLGTPVQGQPLQVGRYETQTTLSFSTIFSHSQEWQALHWFVDRATRDNLCGPHISQPCHSSKCLSEATLHPIYNLMLNPASIGVRAAAPCR